ncbi:unnamed protein product, partial [marine sediment metagenome]
IIGNDAKVLHLFSGTSLIGHTRIDVERPEATNRQDVLSFIKKDSKHWNYIILDPPHAIREKDKLQEYGKTSSVSADVPLRKALAEYLPKHAKNVLWLDMCAPLPAGLRRKKLWFLFPGGYHTIRILSWLVPKP